MIDRVLNLFFLSSPQSPNHSIINWYFRFGRIYLARAGLMDPAITMASQPAGISMERIMEDNLEKGVPRALIADDQSDVLEALQMLLKGEGYQTELVTSPRAVLESLKARNFDLLLMDLNYARDTTSGQEGLDLLSHVQALDSTLPIVVMTAWSSVPLAVEAMRRGVRD